LKLLIVTGKRLTEVVCAKKSDVHLKAEDPWWFLPDTKNGLPDDEPLTATACALFERAIAAAGKNEYLFPAGFK
jgi:integrase